MSTERTVPCEIADVLAGDTLLLHLRLGWGILLTVPCRLAGVLAADPASDEGARQRLALHRAVRSLGAEDVDLAFTSLELDARRQAVGQLIVTDAQGGRHDLAAIVRDA